VELFYETQEHKERKRERASVIAHNIVCEGRGYKDMY
jgi:hypothetical protein